MTRAAPVGLRVAIHLTGGLFDDDRLLELRDRVLTVRDHGRVQARRRVGEEDQAAVGRLAGAAAEVAVPPSKEQVSVDGGTTCVEISLGGRERRIELRAGDETPDPVLTLIEAVESLGRAD